MIKMEVKEMKVSTDGNYHIIFTSLQEITIRKIEVTPLLKVTSSSSPSLDNSV